MIVIGIHNTGINSSAALVIGGKLKFGYLEERISREKYDKSFPTKAIEKLLLLADINYEDVDIFVIAWNPAINIADKYRAGFSEWSSYAGYRFSSNPNHILPQLENKDFVITEQIFKKNDSKPYRISYVSHHFAHASTAFYASKFSSSVIFSCDGYGEKATTAWFVGEGNNVRQLGQINFPHSIGMFYSTLTEYLGFRANLDEWKVMGASAYGTPNVYYKIIKKMFCYIKGLDFKLNLEYFDFYNFDSKNTYTNSLIKLLGPARGSKEELLKRHFDIAAAVQKVTEDYFIGALKDLKSQTNEKNICLSGGSAMNSVVNGIIANSKIFKNVYVPFAPDDSGNSIGAALFASSQEGITIDRKTVASPFLGANYSEDYILSQFHLSKLKPDKPSDIFETTTDLIIDGKIVGWCQDRMEFGQRALGNRSILADPRNNNMKELINSAIKFRESFRPFAPAILENFIDQWFDLSNPFMSPYMEKVVKIKPQLIEKVPAIVHADGSCRLQTVNQKLSPKFYNLIKVFHTKTEIPILLNTSFNINNEPIVDTPSDAIKTFFSSGLDALVIGPYLLRK
jgi:carbamoyltransferase